MPVVQPYFDIQPEMWSNFYTDYMGAYLGQKLPQMEAEYKRRLAAMDPMAKVKIQAQLLGDLAKMRSATAGVEAAMARGASQEKVAIINALGGVQRAIATGDYALAGRKLTAVGQLAEQQMMIESEERLEGVIDEEVTGKVDAAADVLGAALETAAEMESAGENPATIQAMQRRAFEEHDQAIINISADAEGPQRWAIREHDRNAIMARMPGQFTVGQAEAVATRATGPVTAPPERKTATEIIQETRLPSGGSAVTPESTYQIFQQYGLVGAMEPSTQGVKYRVTGPAGPGGLPQVIDPAAYLPAEQGAGPSMPGAAPGPQAPAGTAYAPTGGPVVPGTAQAPSVAPGASSAVEAAILRQLEALEATGEVGQPQPWDYYQRQVFAPQDPRAAERTAKLAWLLKNRPADLESAVNAWRLAHPLQARAAARGIEATQRVVERGERREYAPGGKPAQTPTNPAQLAVAFGPENYPDFETASAASTRWAAEHGLTGAARDEALRLWANAWERKEQETASEAERIAALEATLAAQPPEVRGVPVERVLPAEMFSAFGPGGAYPDIGSATEGLLAVMSARGVSPEAQSSAIEQLSGAWGGLPEGEIVAGSPAAGRKVLREQVDINTPEGRREAMARSEAMVDQLAKATRKPEEPTTTFEDLIGGEEAKARYDALAPEEQAATRKRLAVRLLKRGVTAEPGAAGIEPSMGREGTPAEVAAVASLPEEYVRQPEPAKPSWPEVYYTPRLPGALPPELMDAMARQAEAPVIVPEPVVPSRPVVMRESAPLTDVVRQFGPDRFKTAKEALAASNAFVKGAGYTDEQKADLADTWDKMFPPEAWKASAERPAERIKQGAEDKRLREATVAMAAEEKDVMAPEISLVTPGAMSALSKEDIERLKKEQAAQRAAEEAPLRLGQAEIADLLRQAEEPVAIPETPERFRENKGERLGGETAKDVRGSEAETNEMVAGYFREATKAPPSSLPPIKPVDALTMLGNVDALLEQQKLIDAQKEKERRAVTGAPEEEEQEEEQMTTVAGIFETPPPQKVAKSKAKKDAERAPMAE